MDGIVLQLQAEALDDKTDIETVLRKAYLVARKLNLNDFEKWVSNEQNGYKEKVPEYRMVGGQIKAWNPYHGWIQVVLQGELADVASKMPIGIPISAISDAYNNSNGSVTFTVPGVLSEFLNNNTDGFETNYSFFSSKAEMHRIISAVRNKVLEWSILLEENGIIGENMQFTNEERKKAAETAIINNYTNNFFSSVDNAQIGQGNN